MYSQSQIGAGRYIPDSRFVIESAVGIWFDNH